MARKVFISFLGGSNYGACHYTINGFMSKEVRYIQEATLDYLCTSSHWSSDDVAYILLTKGAEKLNWMDNGHKDRKTGETIIQNGLETCLKEAKLPMQIVPIKNLPDGNNVQEIWTIFERIFALLQDGDELYFDLTHGFRYLPMLSLVLSNYAKFLKNAKVTHLSYGNYEGRDKETNTALIIDLLPLTNLQDWTFAAGQFLDSGNADRLLSISDSETRSIIKENGYSDETKAINQFLKALKCFIDERTTCRGMNILESSSVKKLKECCEQMTSGLLPAIQPVIGKIQQSLEDFDSEKNIKNGYASAVWCFNNGLYQQSATILQECVVSLFCQRHGIKIDDESGRGLLNSAFILLFNKAYDETKWRVDEEKKALLREIMTDDVLQDFTVLSLFNNLTEVRNDFNHSGMRSKRKPMKADKLKENIRKCVEGFKTLFIPEQESC